MPVTQKAALIRRLSPPVDALLAEQLLDEFISLERRFVLRDWEPAELDGGQLAEVLARIIYQADSGTLNPGKPFDECAKFVEDERNPHRLLPRQTALHIMKVLRTIYKFRSARGAVHISPTYSANQMDAKLMMECSRWTVLESFRLFLQEPPEEVAKLVREILQFDVPCVGKFEDILLVQRTDLSTEEEILVLLHYGGEAGYDRREIGRHAKRSAPRITEALKTLASPSLRQILQLPSGKYRLTDLGSKRVRDQLAEKLLLE
jgi:hypothetical protein